MRLGARFRFYLALATILPLGGVAWVADTVARERLSAAIGEHQQNTARALARVVAAQVGDIERVLALQLETFQLDTAPDDVRASFLLVSYRLVPEASAAFLLSPDGSDLTPPLGAAPLTRLKSALRLPTQAREVVVGLPVVAEGMWVPLAVSDPQGQVVLGVLLSLQGIAPVMEEVGGEDRGIAVLDAAGGVLLQAGQRQLVDAEAVAPLMGLAAQDVRYRASGEAVLAALAPVPGKDWTVVVAEPYAHVEAAGRDIQIRTWFVGAVALTGALLMGALLTRSVTDPVLQLREATRRLQRGEYPTTPEEGSDELAELARAFNQMSQTLAQNNAELAEKNAQIEAFNRELQARVEQRTAQLKEAQARLVQSGQLAAVGELAAGVAHALNNPLAGVLGALQVLLGMTPPEEGSLLKLAESQALRCREVLHQLLQLVEPVPAQALPVWAPLEESLGEVLELVRPALAAREVQVTFQRHGTSLLLSADPRVLQQALSQLLTAVGALGEAGATLHIEGVPGGVALRLSAASAREDEWRAGGLGVWGARQVLAGVGLVLEEEPASGRGRSWRLRLGGGGTHDAQPS